MLAGDEDLPIISRVVVREDTVHVCGGTPHQIALVQIVVTAAK